MRIPAAGLVALALVLSGCGGSSTPTPTEQTHTDFGHRLSAKAYRARLHRINREVERSTSIVTGALKEARNVSTVRAALHNYASDQDRIAGEIGRLAVPRNAESANALLARGFRDSESQLRALLPRLGSTRSVSAALALVQANPPAGGNEIDAAVSELKKLGYSSGS